MILRPTTLLTSVSVLSFLASSLCAMEPEAVPSGRPANAYMPRAGEAPVAAAFFEDQEERKRERREAGGERAERRRAPHNEELCILSLDGGGTRGIIPAVFLNCLKHEIEAHLKGVIQRDMETTLGHPLLPSAQQEIAPVVSLAHGFKVMGGTSTGGIIALSLNVPEQVAQGAAADVPRAASSPRDPGDVRGLKACYHPQMLIDLYRQKSATIFPPTSALKGLLKTKYSEKPLVALLGEKFGEIRLSQSIGRVIITGVDLHQERLHLFDSAAAGRTLLEDFPMAAVVQATSAAPTYLPSAGVQNHNQDPHLYADGGLIANNPALSVYLAAKDQYPETRKFYLLSLGTGTSPHGDLPSLQKKGALGWVPHITPLMMDGMSGYIDTSLRQIAALPHSDLVYVRVQPSLTKQHYELDGSSPAHLTHLEGYALSSFKDSSASLRPYISILERTYLSTIETLYPDLYQMVLTKSRWSMSPEPELSLKKDMALTSVGAWVLGKIFARLQEQYLKPLNELHLIKSHLTDDGLKLIAPSLQGLKKLDIEGGEGREFTHDGMKALSASLISLEGFRLKNTPLQDPEVIALRPLLLRPSLKAVTLNGAHLKDQHIDILKEAFARLENLELAHNEITGKGAMTLFTLPSRTLTTLSLRYNSVGSGLVALKDNTSLTSLDVSHNEIQSDHIIALSNACSQGVASSAAAADAPAPTSPLKSLTLSDNLITVKGARAIGSLLTHWPALNNLCLDQNPLGQKGPQMLRQFAEKRPLPLELYIHNPLFSPDEEEDQQ